jgi:hypothetical protein
MRNRRISGTGSAVAVAPASAITMELLGRGAHADPADGGNVLELASVLAGERWNTCPESVHPALAVAAQAVNDLLDDSHRRLLIPLAPWLVGTDTAGAGAWTALAGVCVQAAKHAASRPDQTVPPQADEDPAWDVPVSPSWRKGASRAHRQDQRSLADAIRSAQLSWAHLGNERAAEELCRLLLDCINECRRLAGAQPVDPRLPLAGCPARLQIQRCFIWSPGCDWMEIGYHPVTDLLPSCLRRGTSDSGGAHHGPADRKAASQR